MRVPVVDLCGSHRRVGLLRFDYPMFSDVMTSDAFANELQGAVVSSG
jgi:hypothetical protein